MMLVNSLPAWHIVLPGRHRTPRCSHQVLRNTTSLVAVWLLILVSSEVSSLSFLCAQQRPGETIARDTEPPSLEQRLGVPGQDQGVEGQPSRVLQLRHVADEARTERELKEAVATAPRDNRSVRNLVLFYIAGKRYEEAIGVLSDHVKLCGVTALGYELEAELLFDQKLYDPALEAVIGSLKLFDQNARMHEMLGLLLILKRQEASAAVELRKAAQLDPGRAQTRYFLGRVLYSTGNYDEAREQFLACLKIQPGYRKAFENLGLCYEALQDYPKATQAYVDAIALEEGQTGPKHAEPYAFYGAMLARSTEPEKALPVLHQAVSISPRSFVANYHLGKVLLALRRPKEAEEFLLAAADLYPKFSRTYYLLATIRQKQNRRSEADRYMAMFRDLDRTPENRSFPLTDR